MVPARQVVVPLFRTRIHTVAVAPRAIELGTLLDPGWISAPLAA
jgi:hypothetical protein